jgi:hypothetical protein
MTRILASLALAALLAIAGLIAHAGINGSEPAVAASKHKVCKSKTPTGQVKTWQCGTDQACCVNHDFGLYVCGFAGLGCL